MVPYRQGKPAAADSFKLSSNENPFGPSEKAREAEAARSLTLGVYVENYWTCNGFAPVTYLIMPPWLRTRVG